MSVHPEDKIQDIGKHDGEKGGNRKKGFLVILIAVLLLAVAGAVAAAGILNAQKKGAGKSGGDEPNTKAVEALATEKESSVSDLETTASESETVPETTKEQTTVPETTAGQQETTTVQSEPQTGDDGNFQFEDTGDTKYAYLTFDDGPSDNTYPILDILDQYGVKGTFFTIGRTDPDSVNKYKAIAERGHALGMHSYTHDYRQIYASLDNFMNDVQSIHDWLYQVTGQDVRLYRFPGGSSNTVSDVDMHTMIDYITSQGYIYYDWNVSSGDASGKPITAEEIVGNIVSQAQGYKKIMVLMHDSNPKTETVRALPGIIENLQNAGYQIVPITNRTKPVQHVKAVYMQ